MSAEVALPKQDPLNSHNTFSTDGVSSDDSPIKVVEIPSFRHEVIEIGLSSSEEDEDNEYEQGWEDENESQGNAKTKQEDVCDDEVVELVKKTRAVVIDDDDSADEMNNGSPSRPQRATSSEILSVDDVDDDDERDESCTLSDSSEEAEWKEENEFEDAYNGEMDAPDAIPSPARRSQSIFIVDSDDEEEPRSGGDSESGEEEFNFEDADSLDSLKVYRRRASLQPTRMSKAAFSRNRQSLADEAFTDFDIAVFSGKLAGHCTIEWSKTLRTTAGLTRMHRNRRDGTRTAKIELSIKVLDDMSRLRETLMHEMIHAATWLIDRVDKPGHGAIFQKWGRRAEKKFRDITVSTRHNYEISYKYSWTCVDCKCVIGRQSRSIDVSRQVCGKCHGRLVETTQKKKPSAYNVFVKEQSVKVRQQMEMSGVKVTQADVMKECARLWRLRNPSE